MKGSSKIAIFNRALKLMGISRSIQDPNEDTADATVCRQMFETALNSLLTLYPWFWCRVRTTAAATADGAGEWAYSFIYPDGCLKIRAVYNADNESIEFQTGMNSGGVRCVFAKVQPLYYDYTFAVTDPTTFPPLFEEALCWNLARYICYGLEGVSTSTRDEISKQFAVAQADAAEADANESKLAPFEFSSDYAEQR